jgi:hypothetical protein
MELVDYYFKKPTGGDAGEFMPTAIAKQIVSTLGTSISTVALGRAFSRQGFLQATINKTRRYFVVRRTEEERRMRARTIAYETTRELPQITDDTDSG